MLGQDQVDLIEAGPMQRAALQVAEGARLWRRERGRIEKHDVAAREERIHARHQIGATHVARVAAAWRIDHGRSAYRRVVEHAATAVDVDDVRARDADVNWQPAARIDNAADVP